MVGSSERLEIDSQVDFQLPLDDSLELGATADLFAEDGRFLEVSDNFDLPDDREPLTEVPSSANCYHSTAVRCLPRT